MFRKGVALLLLASVALLLERCVGLPQYVDDETAEADLVRAALLVSDMLNTSGNSARTRLDADTTNDINACSVLYNGNDCNAGVRSYTFTDAEGRGCPLKSGLRVFGSNTFTFSDPSCDDGLDGTIDRVVAGHYFERDDGKRYLVYTSAGQIGPAFIVADDLKTYLGETKTGGHRMVVNSGTRTLTISGVHQWSVYRNSYGFHHTLYTEGSQSIDVGVSGTDATLNGFATLTQNRSSLSYLVQYQDTKLAVDCRYPVDGRVTFYKQASAAVTATPTPTPTGATPTPTVTPTPGGPTATPTPTPTPHLVYPVESQLDVTFPGTCGAGAISRDGATPTPVELLP